MEIFSIRTEFILFAEHFLGTTEITGEWSTLVNLAGLLLGFAILTKHFEDSGIPGYIPGILPG